MLLESNENIFVVPLTVVKIIKCQTACYRRLKIIIFCWLFDVVSDRQIRSAFNRFCDIKSLL